MRERSEEKQPNILSVWHSVLSFLKEQFKNAAVLYFPQKINSRFWTFRTSWSFRQSWPGVHLQTSLVCRWTVLDVSFRLPATWRHYSPQNATLARLRGLFVYFPSLLLAAAECRSVRQRGGDTKFQLYASVLSHWSRPLNAGPWLVGGCYRVGWGESSGGSVV